MQVLLIGMDIPGQERVREALRWMKAAAPDHYRHFVREIRAVAYMPGACGDAVACTGGRFRRTAVLSENPAQQSLITLTTTLWHESAHHQREADGTPYVLPHECDDCRSVVERASDWIYVEEGKLYELLNNRRYLIPSSHTWVGELVGAAVLTVGVVALTVGVLRFVDELTA